MAEENKNINNEEVNDDSIALNFTDLNSAMLYELKNYLKSEVDTKFQKFSKSQIRKYLQDPQKNEQKLREISRYLYVSSSHYRRLINYFSSILTLDHVVTPIHVKKDKLDKKGFEKAYHKSMKFIDNYNIKHELSKVTSILVLEGVFFGYERSVGNSFMLQRIPSDYSRIVGIQDGVFTYAFDMSYFDKNKELLGNYPQEFQRKYKKYLSDKKQQWQEIEGGVAFKLDEEIMYNIPPFTGVYEEIIDLEESKELMKTKDKLDNFKLIHQKIPFKKDPKSEKDFLISLDSVKMFHNNIKSTLPDGIKLVSSPMDLDSITLEKRKDALKEGFSESENSIFNHSGVSKGLFNSGNNNAVSLNRGINVDEAMMFDLLRKFERYFRKRLSEINDNTHQFKLIFPDLTVYNRKEKFDQYLKAAQYGFPKSFVAASLGYSPSELIGLNQFENDFLDLGESMTPLSSSHTSSEQNGRGRPRKSDDELSESGEKTRGNDDNQRE